MSRAPRMVLFDADGVLQHRSWSGLRADLAFLVDPDEADAFVTDVLAAEVPCLSGLRSFDDAIAEVLSRWECSVPVREVLAIWERIEVDPSMVEIVREVRRTGTRVALASNQWSGRARKMNRRFGYDRLFDALFYSCDLGAAKPSEEFFRRVLALLELAGGEVLFIDDSEANVAAASAMGLRAERFGPGSDASHVRRLLEAHGLALPLWIPPVPASA